MIPLHHARHHSGSTTPLELQDDPKKIARKETRMFKSTTALLTLGVIVATARIAVAQSG